MNQHVSTSEAYSAEAADVVQIWIARSDTPQLRDATLLLDEDERARHDSHKLVAHRNDYAAAHALKRMALALCLPGAKPSALRFGRHSSGKPYLLDAPLYFNLSHSRGLVAVAVSLHGEVGMDIEVHGCEASAQLIARRTMTAPEQAAIAAASNPLQSFYERWTIKEALVKATGHGLATDFRTICTEYDLKRVRSDQGYVGALNVYWRSALNHSYAASRFGGYARFIEHVV
ncbi:MAG: 4'-phosphopantetheinyl transferase superfamily protein [Pseudomonadota bacterium]